ncbi:MAG: rod shape-determining protein [Solitalea-like symbiont of Acarus siro]
MGLLDIFKKEVAIDLGTANTLIIHKDKLVIDEPSIVTINTRTNRLIAIGREAMMMEGKTHENIKTIRPLKDGVIADFDAAEYMIRSFIKMINDGRKWIMPSLRVMICIPSGITEVEKRAVRDSAEMAGAKEVYLIHEPMAAALGIGIDVDAPTGSMVIDIGGGTTEIAVIALSGIVCDQSIRVAGDDFNTDIINYIRREHNILIGTPTAEKIKIEIGSALTELPENEAPNELDIQGRDLMTGIPKQITISYKEISLCLDKSISKIEESVLKALEMTPPELSSDIYKNGVNLTGGGALLRGLAARISNKVKLPVIVANDPLKAVVRGTGMALKNISKFKFLVK